MDFRSNVDKADAKGAGAEVNMFKPGTMNSVSITGAGSTPSESEDATADGIRRSRTSTVSGIYFVTFFSCSVFRCSLQFALALDP